MHIPAGLRSRILSYCRAYTAGLRSFSTAIETRARRQQSHHARSSHAMAYAAVAAFVTGFATRTRSTGFALAPPPATEELVLDIAEEEHSVPTNPRASRKASSVSQLGRYAVADAVEKVSASVVNIRRTTRRSVPARRPAGLFGSLPSPFAEPIASEIDSTQVSGGSGFIVAREGKTYYVLTNSHVVQEIRCPGCEHCSGLPPPDEETETTLEITLASGESFSGTLSAADAMSDLAVVTIESDTPLPVAELGDSEALRPGEFVVAVGSPLQVLSNSCSFGIVSSVHRDLEPATGTNSGGMTFLQVDCAINPGSSGGPLVDLDGKVLGVCSMKIGGVNALNTLGQDEAIAVEGISFAIPISFARNVLHEFKLHGQVRRPYVGLALVSINKEVVAEMKDREDYYVPDWLHDGSKTDVAGLLVHKVDRGSPGEAASLQRGDVIVGIDGVSIRTTNDFMSAIAFKFEDSKVRFEVRRAKDGRVENVVASPAVLIPEDGNK